MNNEMIEKVIREYVGKTVHLSLATVSENKPWVCEVHFAYDDNLNLYFVSKPTSRHCLELSKNPHVAGNIVAQHSLTEAPHGIYFEGTAEVVTSPSDEDIQRYCEALGRDTAELKEQLLQVEGRRMYQIKVENWATFGNFDGSGTAKHELAWGRS